MTEFAFWNGSEATTAMSTAITPPDDTHAFLCAYMPMMTFAAASLNAIFLAASFRERELWQPLHWLLVMMALSDLISAIVAGVTNSISNCSRSYAWGESWCSGEGFIVGICGILNLTLIGVLALFRYVVVCRPSRLGEYDPTTTHAFIAGASAFCWSLFWNLLQLFSGGYHLEVGGTNCGPSWDNEREGENVRLVFFVVFCFGMIVALSMFCYVKILVHLRQATSSLNSSETIRTAEFRLTMVTVMVGIAFVFCWGPYAVMSLMTVFGYEEGPSYLGVRIYSIYSGKSSTIVNPIIYAIFNKKIRKAMTKVFDSIFCCCGELQEEEKAEQDAVIEDGAIALQPLPIAEGSSSMY